MQTTIFPSDHWRLATPIPYGMGLAEDDFIVLGGQVDAVGADFEKILKVNTYYCGTGDPAELRDSLRVRNGYLAVEAIVKVTGT